MNSNIYVTLKCWLCALSKPLGNITHIVYQYRWWSSFQQTWRPRMESVAPATVTNNPGCKLNCSGDWKRSHSPGDLYQPIADGGVSKQCGNYCDYTNRVSRMDDYLRPRLLVFMASFVVWLTILYHKNFHKSLNMILISINFMKMLHNIQHVL